MIEAGAQAPDFSLLDQDGKPVTLSELRGQPVLLAFYPADFSPVCTDQLSVYQADLAEFDRRGVRVLGISVDNVYCHKAFQRQLDLTIPLLADFHPKGKVSSAYGVWSERYGLAGRALVLVGPDGTVEWSHKSPALEYPATSLVFEKLARFENSR